MIGRRRFIAAATATAGLAALPGCRRLEHLGIPVTVLRPGMEAGHALRERAPLPAARREIHTGVAILGSGMTAYAAAKKHGVQQSSISRALKRRANVCPCCGQAVKPTKLSPYPG